MRVLAVNQFYPPDPAPTGVLLQDLVQALTLRGHEVSVLCSRGSYAGGRRGQGSETRDGIPVERLWTFGFSRRSAVGKVLDYACFYAGLAARLCAGRPRPDLVVVLTSPPFMGALARRVPGLGRVARAVWIMDLYPDVMAAHGMLARGGFPFRALEGLSRQEFLGSRVTLCIGPDMAERVRRRIGAGATGTTRVTWIPLWADAALSPWSGEERNALRSARGWPAGETVLMYSGNLGLGHRFGEFLSAAERSSAETDLRWVFAGDGRRRPEVERFCRQHPRARVTLLPHVPGGQLREHLCSADVHLISLDSRWRGCIVPSKIQSVFAVGKPVILVGDTEGVAARWIEQCGAGWVVGEGDVAGLLAAVAASRDRAERERRGRAAAAFARQHFDRARNCARMCETLEEATRGKHS